MRDEDVSHISHVYVPSAEENRFFELGDATWDTCSLHLPLPHAPKHKAIQFFYPLENTSALEDAGLETSATWASKSLSSLIVHCLPWEDVLKARELMGRKGLTKEELMCPIRIACQDFSQGRDLNS